MSVPAPRETICLICVGEEGSEGERKALIRVSSAVVRVYVPDGPC